jgi:FAD/FMN-containing dehydrogenase
MATMSTPAWEALGRGLAGEVVLPASSSYAEWSKGFNARFHDVRPQAVVLCANPQDVSETIGFLRRYGLDHVTRSGGHCFGGMSTTGGVIVDVTPMRTVTASGDHATVGAGTRLGDLYDQLQTHDRTVPGGTCPPVGIAGLALGGGLGILGRTYGVTSDSLVGARIVLADGRAVDCDEHHDDDLFWALRGGGGSFGVVTELTFRTVPSPNATNLNVSWPVGAAAAVVDAWQRWAPTAPDELAASLKLTTTADVDEPLRVDVYATLLGAESDATGLVDQVVDRVGTSPTSATHQHMSYPETRRFWAYLGVADASVEAAASTLPADQPHLASKSEFFERPLPAEAIDALIERFARDRVPGESRELDFMPWAGAYNRVPPAATAFVHRDQLFQLKHAAVVDADETAATKASAHRWVARSWATVHPWGSGHVFQNFADPDLEDWARAYYGANYGRLVRVKTRYDPSNFFRFHQSIGLGP